MKNTIWQLKTPGCKVLGQNSVGGGKEGAHAGADFLVAQKKKIRPLAKRQKVRSITQYYGDQNEKGEGAKWERVVWPPRSLPKGERPRENPTEWRQRKGERREKREYPGMA